MKENSKEDFIIDLIRYVNYITIERNYWKLKASYLDKEISKEEFIDKIDKLYSDSNN